MQHRIVAATAHRGYTVELLFESGERGSVNLADFAATGTVTEPLRRDPDLFATAVRVEGDWIAWPGGVEIDADALWYQPHPDDLRQDSGPEAA